MKLLSNLGPVHTYPFSYDNATFSLRIRLPCTCIRWKRKRKRWGHTISFNLLRAILETYSRWRTRAFPFLSFILGLISDLIACFQANLALLILQADYSRRRQNIIRLLSLPVSRGRRLDLPSVWLCFCPDFDILNCFCAFEERHNDINPH